MRKDQYIIKNAYRRPIMSNKLTRSNFPRKFDDSFTFDADGYVVPEGVSLCDPKICSTILCNYSRLKEDILARRLKRNMEKFTENPISLNKENIQLFPNIETFHIYNENDNYILYSLYENNGRV